MPWLSMSAEGLRMISIRSTSSAGMRSTSTVLSFVPPVMRRPLTRTCVYSLPTPRSEGSAYSPMSLWKLTPGTRFIMSPTESGSKRWKKASSYERIGAGASTRLRALTRLASTSISVSSGWATGASAPCCANAAWAAARVRATATVMGVKAANVFIG